MYGYTNCDPTFIQNCSSRNWRSQRSQYSKNNRTAENKKRAIQIVKDGGMKAGAQCPMNAQDIEEYYTEKVQLRPPIIYPEWYTSLDLPEPDQDASSGLITPEEVLKVIKELPNSKSLGADGVTYETLKANPVYARSLAHIYNVCWINHKVPSQWKHGMVTLIPKKAPDSVNLDDWRPISLLVTNYKIFMAIVSKRLLPWIVDNQRLSPK